VRTDPHRLDQILRNLLENAMKFSPPQSRVFLEGLAKDDWFEVSVTDHGTGIAHEDLPRIFDRFHQVGEAMTREAEGAGLGLYITKRLVEAMGGTVTVTSTPGKGSTFRVWLPNRPAEEDAAEPADAGGAAQPGPDASEASLSRSNSRPRSAT
jgi:signal transduction histidine kinase